MNMIKYSFEMLLANSDLATKAMQEWIHSPIGAAITVCSILGTLSCSLITNYQDKKEKQRFEIIVFAWPYARDFLKSLLNALRGVRSTITLFYILNINDLQYLIIPGALFVGIISAINRVWIRYKSGRQNELLKQNADLLREIEELETLSPEQIEITRRKISKQSQLLQANSILAAILSGFIDGINPYIGTLTLVTLSSPALLLITAFCGTYFFAVLATLDF